MKRTPVTLMRTSQRWKVEDETEDDAEQVSEEEKDCECGGEDSECDCRFEDDSDPDEESERSYEGSDADDYYDLKKEREERKWEKLQERMEKDRVLELERSKEEEVRAAYKSLRKAEKEHRTIPVESLASQGFKLFCSDHVNHCHDDYYFYPTKEVKFYHMDGTWEHPFNPHVRPESGYEADMLYGRLYLNDRATCTFGPFRPRSHASWKPVKVKSSNGVYELSFQFIGKGYLKLRLSSEFVFMDRHNSDEDPPPTAPEVFDFVGIWFDRDKELEEAEQREAEMELRRLRAPSPRESWFELNHPMGARRSGW
ncbi:hypothetical protein Daus18300_011576 [Diaporthe australafricana]|uniref:Uncharacterized protein n=1 Tax=Diaporthe australafricana TaxID=127596 RepID=A0ABR3W5Y4_9PEZI